MCFMCIGRFESPAAVVLLILIAVVSVAAPSLALAQNRLALSPDGTVAAYAQGSALWVVSTVAGKPSKIADVGGRGYPVVPRWSPSGDRLAYYSHQSGSLQLWLYDLRTRTSKQISFVESGIDPSPGAGLAGGWSSDPLRYSWSPDGSRIAFTSRVAVNQAGFKGAQDANGLFPTSEELEAGKPIVLTGGTPRAWTLHGVVSYGQESSDPYTLNSVDNPDVSTPRTTQIFLLDVATGKASQLTDDAAGYFTPEWSPDGKRLAYMSAEGQPLLRGSVFESNIFTFELATARKIKVTQGRMQKTLPRWSPDGEWIAYLGKDIGQAFVRRDREVYVVRADGSSASSTGSHNVTTNIDRDVRGVAEWSPDGSEILTVYVDGLWTQLVSIDAMTGAVAAMSPPNADVSSSGGVASSRGGVIWMQLTDPNGATTLWFRGKRGEPRALLETEPAVDPQRSRRWEIVQWRNKQEEALEGILVYPLGYVPQKRYPLVVDTYGAVSMRREGYDEINYVKASLRYFVFRPNHRAPHMYVNPRKSAVYDAAAVGPTGIAIMTNDILSGVDALIERRLVDSSRMCVAGFSNGALEGAQLLMQTDRFKCAMLQSGNYNWLTYASLSTDPSDSIFFTYRIAPWENASIHVQLSPVLQADRITTPILLAVGDLDSVVIQAVELYNVLRYLNKEVTLLRYPKQGHGFSGAAQEDFTKRVESFFATYLERQRPDVSSHLSHGASEVESKVTAQ